jgi:predicted transcriptional regulator
MRKKQPEERKAMDTVTTTVTFDREIYRRLRHQAVDEDSDARAVIRRAVEEYLEKHGGGR